MNELGHLPQARRRIAARRRAGALGVSSHDPPCGEPRAQHRPGRGGCSEPSGRTCRCPTEPASRCRSSSSPSCMRRSTVYIEVYDRIDSPTLTAGCVGRSRICSASSGPSSSSSTGAASWSAGCFEPRAQPTVCGPSTGHRRHRPPPVRSLGQLGRLLGRRASRVALCLVQRGTSVRPKTCASDEPTSPMTT